MTQFLEKTLSDQLDKTVCEARQTTVQAAGRSSRLCSGVNEVPADALVMIRHVREMLGVEVLAVEQPINFDVPEERVMLGVYVTMPEADNLRWSVNITRGVRQAKREGGMCQHL